MLSSEHYFTAHYLYVTSRGSQLNIEESSVSVAVLFSVCTRCLFRARKKKVCNKYKRLDFLNILPPARISERDNICWCLSEYQGYWHSCFKQLLTRPFGTHELLLVGRRETVYIHSNTLLLCFTNTPCSCILPCANSNKAIGLKVYIDEWDVCSECIHIFEG